MTETLTSSDLWAAVGRSFGLCIVSCYLTIRISRRLASWLVLCAGTGRWLRLVMLATGLTPGLLPASLHDMLSQGALSFLLQSRGALGTSIVAIAFTVVQSTLVVAPTMGLVMERQWALHAGFFRLHSTTNREIRHFSLYPSIRPLVQVLTIWLCGESLRQEAILSKALGFSVGTGTELVSGFIERQYRIHRISDPESAIRVAIFCGVIAVVSVLLCGFLVRGGLSFADAVGDQHQQSQANHKSNNPRHSGMLNAVRELVLWVACALPWVILINRATGTMPTHASLPFHAALWPASFAVLSVLSITAGFFLNSWRVGVRARTIVRRIVWSAVVVRSVPAVVTSLIAGLVLTLALRADLLAMLTYICVGLLYSLALAAPLTSWIQQTWSADIDAMLRLAGASWRSRYSFVVLREGRPALLALLLVVFSVALGQQDLAGSFLGRITSFAGELSVRMESSVGGPVSIARLVIAMALPIWVALVLLSGPIILSSPQPRP